MLGKDKLEEEANAAAARKVPADVRAKQVLWVAENKAAAESVFATLTKDKPGMQAIH